MARFVRSLLLLTGRCACSFAYAVEPGVNNPLLSELRPWCIGRLMFDRPVSSEISDERYEYRGESWRRRTMCQRRTTMPKSRRARRNCVPSSG